MIQSQREKSGGDHPHLALHWSCRQVSRRGAADGGADGEVTPAPRRGDKLKRKDGASEFSTSACHLVTLSNAINHLSFWFLVTRINFPVAASISLVMVLPRATTCLPSGLNVTLTTGSWWENLAIFFPV